VTDFVWGLGVNHKIPLMEWLMATLGAYRSLADNGKQEISRT